MSAFNTLKQLFHKYLDQDEVCVDVLYRISQETNFSIEAIVFISEFPEFEEYAELVKAIYDFEYAE